MADTHTKDLGKKGEEIALNYLLAKGYVHLQSNYRYKRCEIDLIMQQNNTYVFIEVKLRSSLSYGTPESFVSQKQQDCITEAAEEFVLQQNWQHHIRFDILAVYVRATEENILHLQDAFE